MKKYRFLVLVAISGIIVAGKCGKDNTTPPDPCATSGLNITLVSTASSPCQATGSITATASGGTALQYQLDNGTFGTSPSFPNVASGSHTVNVKNAEGCTKTATITVAATGASGITITQTIKAAEDCQTTGDGEIDITASGTGTSFEYKLDNGTFGANKLFTGVTPGSHTISVKNNFGCIETKSITVPLKPDGALFTAVKTLLNAKCAPCHTSNNSGNFNIMNDCNIVAKKDRIVARAVTAGDMPPSGAFDAPTKKIITDWVAAGGKKSS